jgi:serine/threonine-protein kinase
VPEAVSAVSPGQILAGKYQVERVLGEGGFGVVVAAIHLQLRQRVALKFLLSHALREPAIVERFVREARAMAGLKSQHVARVTDIGSLPDGAPYIVMELLEGEDLGQVVEKRGRLDVPAAAAAVLEACEAIGEAHELGIIHRDIKPANLFRARGAGGHPIIKVLDFGISKMASAEDDHALTRTHAVFGSPVYASPEQLRSTKHVDHRTDIWSLGVTLYQLVSGRLPFAGDTLSDVAIRVAMDPMPRFDPALGIPPRFEAVVARCLEKEPAARYSTIADLAADLAEFAGVPVRRASVPPSVPVTTLTEATGEAARGTVGSGRRGFAVAVSTTLLVGAAAAGTFVVLGARRSVKPAVAVGEGAPAPVPQPLPAPAPPAPAPPATPDAGPARAAKEPSRPARKPPPASRSPAPTYGELVIEGDRLANQRACERAIPVFERAIAMDPGRVEAHIMLGYCLLARKDGARAVDVFRAALAIEPRAADTNFGLAEAYSLLGMWPEARAQYARCIELTPAAPKAEAARRRIESLDAAARAR